MEKGEEAFAAHKQEIAEDTERIRAELEAQREKTEKDAEATRQHLEASWANAKKAWESAWARCQVLTQNANVMQAECARLSSSLAQMRPPKVDRDGNVDRNDERRYVDATRRLESSISTIDFQLANLYAEYEVVNRNGMIIENQMNTIRMNAQRLGMTLAAQEGSFAKVDKLVRGKERAAQKAEPKLEAKKLRFARAYSTYNDFNFHKESAILAKSFP